MFPERLAVPFRPPAVGVRATRPTPRPATRGPGSRAQERRLAPAFERLTNAFNAERIRLQDDPDALEPERILVLEIAGELADFINAVARIEGLEWLAEASEDQLDADDEFAVVTREGRRKPYARQLFIVASDQRAWQELLRLWESYKRGDEFQRGLTPFRNLFDLLRDLREWDDRDRLERSGATEAWTRDLAGLGDQLVPFEAELWLRNDEGRRRAERDAVAAGLQTVGGQVLQELVLEEIGYHGLLGEAPAHLLVDAARNAEVRWLRTEGVRLFHPVGQAVVPEFEELVAAAGVELDGIELPPRASPRVAFLDGLPIENHDLLAGRIEIDDPDDWALMTPAASRIHGTAMASLVVHGDLSAGEPVLTELVYIRPILRVEAPPWLQTSREELPSDRLVVDTVYSAIARMLEGDAAVAPGVSVIGLAIGDPAQQFDRFMSPLARLLDWLSFRYQVLFLVSAGNHTADLALPVDIDVDDPNELQHEVLDFIRRNALSRRLLSPAESMNSLTIGAAHKDSSAVDAPDGHLDPLSSSDLASIISPLASGFRRSIKPDVLLPGGRQMMRPARATAVGETVFEVVQTTRPPGLRAASPDPRGATRNSTAHFCGTSGASALALRAGALLLAELDALRAAWGEQFPSEGYSPVLIKALLVHTARWRSGREAVAAVLNGAGESAGRAAIGRFLGYGRAEPEDALAIQTDNRITALYAADIEAGDAHTFRLPLPPSLAGSTVERRLTITLAWLSPINPSHRFYRRAALAVVPGGEDDVFGSRDEVDANATRRGTVQHEILRGGGAVPYVDGANAEFVVSCRADAGVLDSSIPYALVVTLDVPLGVQLPIYTEIRERLTARIPVRPPA